MKATFNFKVCIEDSNVQVIMNTEEISGIGVKTMKPLIKVFEDVENKVQKIIVTPQEKNENGNTELMTDETSDAKQEQIPE